jgi:hypothetical protein
LGESREKRLSVDGDCETTVRQVLPLLALLPNPFFPEKRAEDEGVGVEPDPLLCFIIINPRREVFGVDMLLPLAGVKLERNLLKGFGVEILVPLVACKGGEEFPSSNGGEPPKGEDDGDPRFPLRRW